MYDPDLDCRVDDAPELDDHESESFDPPESREPEGPLPWHHPIEGLPHWERWPDESGRAYLAFCAYRDLGPTRSLVNAYRLQKGCEKAAVSGGWHKWRKSFHWKARAEAFDRQRVSDLREAKRQLDRELLGLRLQRQTRVYSAYASFTEELLRRTAETLPGLTLIDEVEPRDNGGKTVKRGNSPAQLARLLQQIRELESCVAHGFPQPIRYGW